ncbi:MAG: IS481 family transposase [Candidatus Eisenbacteria bacterium]
MDQKRLFINAYVRGALSISELCTRFGVSRKTGYKWIRRFEAQGLPGLEDRSRRPQTSPFATDREITTAILELRRRHPFWGAKKLLQILHRRHPRSRWPARSTVCDLLKRNGLVESRTRRRYPGHGGRPTTPMTAPNEIWCADSKGEFKTSDGIYCYPLTVTDGYSRYLIACQGLGSTAHEGARPVFLRLFREFGLPQLIRTDNGVPFATTALGRLSRLPVWWIQLGIYPELIEPGHPEQNGRHERMHRTLKRHTARPPASTGRAQQRRFNAFRTEYNEERPHEALDQHTPASRYQRSERELPTRLSETDYPPHFERRLVSRTGGIRWSSRWVNVSHVLGGEYVGLEEVGDGVWDLYFGLLRLGHMDERHGMIEDALGRRARKRLSPMSPD